MISFCGDGPRNQRQKATAGGADAGFPMLPLGARAIPWDGSSYLWK